MKIVELTEEHLARLALLPAQASIGACLSDIGYAKELCGYESFAGLEEGRIVCASGIVPTWRGSNVAWALLSAMSMRTMVELTHAVKTWLGDYDGRLETWVDARHPGHVRWAEKLGFEREGLMRKFLPDGGDAFLYARVN